MLTRDAKSTPSQIEYSFTRFLFSAVWIFSAFTIAQLADGYSFNPLVGLLFSALLGVFAGQIKSTYVLGAYVAFTILLSHFSIAAYSMRYSADQFFPSFWGPLDFLLMVMMWSAPLIVIIAEFFDSRISEAFDALIVKALIIFKEQPRKYFELIKHFVSSHLRVLFDQWKSTTNSSRAPPLLIN